MGNRLYSAGVVLFWLATMSWLVGEKVAPGWMAEAPPPTGTLRQDSPVAWAIDIDGVDCGAAVLQAVGGEEDVREVHSFVKLERIPRPQSLPFWLESMAVALDKLSLETRTRTVFDGFGRLARFETRVRVSQLEFPIKITGVVGGDVLRLAMRAGQLYREVERAWPEDGVLANDVVPESKLITLYPGKRWRREVYSPIGSATEPLEVLDAEVIENVKINHDGEAVVARLVEFRSPGRTGASDAELLRARMWVAEDGEVLKQETYLFGSRLTFRRLNRDASREAAERDLQLDRRASTLVPDLESARTASPDET